MVARAEVADGAQVTLEVLALVGPVTRLRYPHPKVTTAALVVQTSRGVEVEVLHNPELQDLNSHLVLLLVRVEMVRYRTFLAHQ
jgi:hypothetical protein